MSLMSFAPRISFVTAALILLTVLPFSRADAYHDLYDGSLDFSASGYNIVRDHADLIGNGCTGLSPGKLLLIALAPTWPETGATESTGAPSPMTLSRWDLNDADLWATRNKSTGVYFHPGVGVWQVDHGLEAFERLTTAQRIVITPELVATVMTEMKRAYCQAAKDLTDPQEAAVAGRRAAWSRWFGCTETPSTPTREVCEYIYGRHISSSYDGTTGIYGTSVSTEGGLKKHSCRVGSGPTFQCWYYDPANIQGYSGWTSGGSSYTPAIRFVTHGTTADGSSYDNRVWFRDWHAGSFDYHGIRPEGNARDTLRWSTSTYLCDVTLGKGECSTSKPDYEVLLDFVLGIQP